MHWNFKATEAQQEPRRRLSSWQSWAAALLTLLGLTFAAPVPVTLADWDMETAVFLVLVNEYRQQNGQGPLEVDAKLQRAADWHSNDQLFVKKCTQARPFTCGHDDSLGRQPEVRARDQFGYPANLGVGENVVWDAFTGKQALESWKLSPGHNANMLAPQWKATGIGRSCDGGACMFTQVFGIGMSEAFPATPLPGMPADFNGSWSASFDMGRVVTTPITLIQNGDQVTGTLGMDFNIFQPTDAAKGAQLTGKVVPGTPKVLGTLVQPAGPSGPEQTGIFEIGLLGNGMVSAQWRTGDRIWTMRDAPRATAGTGGQNNNAQPVQTVPNPNFDPAPITTDPGTPPAQDIPAGTMDEEPIEDMPADE